MGYSDILKRLAARIFDTQRHEQTVFVVAGMGGIGKTEIVLQFLQDPDIRKTFWGVFWIDCSTEISAQESFSRIAVACGWNVVSLQDIKDRLANQSMPILLILDNCDNSDVDYSGTYIPFASHIKVLLTGRPKALDRYASLDIEGNQDYQYIDGLSKQSCKDLILILSKNETLRNTIHIADDLAALLGYHPLAVHVACSFIRSQQWTISDYVAWLKDTIERPKSFEHRIQKAETGFLDQTTIDAQYGKIYNTFEISAQVLESEAHNYDFAAIWALELLTFIACVDRTNISRDLSIRAWSFEAIVMERTADSMTLGLTDRHIKFCRQFLDKSKVDACGMVACSSSFRTEKKRRNHGVQDLLVTGKRRELETWVSLLKYKVLDVDTRLDFLRQAMARLCAVELATMNDNRNAISLHPVVHSWAKLRRDRNGRKNKAMAISGSLLALAVGDTVDWLPRNTDLRRHMEAYLMNENWSPIESDRALANEARSRNASDEELLDSDGSSNSYIARRIARKVSILRLIDKCRIHMTLAYPLVHMRSTKVTEDLKSLVEALGNLSGQAACGMHRLRAQELLNASLDKIDPVKIPQQEDVVAAIQSRGSGSAHDLQVAQCNLADAYLEGGRTTEAIEYLQQLESRYDVGDYEYDNDLLAIQELLGVAYRIRGEPDLAVQVLQRVVENREMNEEASDETLCTAKRELAQAYLDAGRLDIALQILEVTCEKMHETRHKDDHFLLLMQQTLALAWDAVGDSQIAIELLTNVVETRREIYGPQQPECREAIHLLETIKEKVIAAEEADDSSTWTSMDEELPPPDPGVMVLHSRDRKGRTDKWDVPRHRIIDSNGQAGEWQEYRTKPVEERKIEQDEDDGSEDVGDEDESGGVGLDNIIGN